MPEEMSKGEQEKILLYQLLQTRLEELKKQSLLLEQGFLEIENTVTGLNTLKKMEKEKEVLMPFGSGCYTPSTIKQVKKLLVDIGAGIVMEKTIPEIEEVLEERKDEIGKALTNLQNEANDIVNKMGAIANELQQKGG
jgi:prefoldin alpha subunit